MYFSVLYHCILETEILFFAEEIDSAINTSTLFLLSLWKNYDKDTNKVCVFVNPLRPETFSLS